MQVETLTIAIRVTARVSLALFLGAFAGQGAWRLWPNRFTEWLTRNRPWLLVGLLISHAMHLAMILWRGAIAHIPKMGLQNWTVIIGGGFVYLLIVLMAATSFGTLPERPGTGRLHGFGMYYVWLIFALAYVPRGFKSSFYALFAAATVLALIVRLWGAKRAARHALAASAG